MQRQLSIFAITMATKQILSSAFVPNLQSKLKSAKLSKSLNKLFSTNDFPTKEYLYTQLDSSHSNTSQYERDLQRVLTTIERAAYTAGELTLSTAGKIAIKGTKVNIRDLVTESDVQCQALIKDVIMKEFPEDVFMGEEDSGVGSMDSIEALKISLGAGTAGRDRLLFVVVSSLFYIMKRILSNFITNEHT